jgi:hypothetical protein
MFVISKERIAYLVIVVEFQIFAKVKLVKTALKKGKSEVLGSCFHPFNQSKSCSIKENGK